MLKIDAQWTVDRVVDHVETTLLAPLGLAPTFTSVVQQRVGQSKLISHWSWLVETENQPPAPAAKEYFSLNALENRTLTWGVA
eukprot:2791840-Prymnesium_polylepis.1